MLKNEWKATIAITGAILIPSVCQADTSTASQAPSYLPGEKVKQGALPAGYNETASYTCETPWKLDLSGDYIWWKWQQDFLIVGTFSAPTALGASGLFNGSQDVIFQTPSYRSGFQLGLGCDLRGMDDWRLSADYTWYKNTGSSTYTASGTEGIVVSPNLYQHVTGATPGVLISQDLTTSAHMNYNSVDLILERPFYFGRKLTANFIAGLEALWISQKFTSNGNELSFIGSDVVIADSVNGSFNSLSKQKSWGLGPKFGLDSNWLLGWGFKIMGQVSFSALFTSYITLMSSTTGSVSNINVANLEINQSKNYNTVNPVAEAFLGLGWGTYLRNNRFHLDFSAGYDFKVFWNQYVLASLVNGSGAPGNMTLRGLNIQVRCDF